jgi:hypothetical protein
VEDGNETIHAYQRETKRSGKELVGTRPETAFAVPCIKASAAAVAVS